MKIRALRVAELGPFSEPVAIDGFTGGLDLLVGPNELGKSTLFRAIEAVFFALHSSTAQHVAALTPRRGGSPLVEADFEVGARRWRIRKRFGRGNSAELFDLDAGLSMARGREAEEQLQRLVGASGAARGPFGLLWVGQQSSLILPSPDETPDTGKATDRGEKRSLRAAIAREIESVASGDVARRVHRAVEVSLSGYFTAKRRTPKKGSSYEIALAKRAEMLKSLAEARAGLAAAEQRLERLSDLTDVRLAQASPSEIARLRSLADEAATAAGKAEKAEGERAGLISREQAARLSSEQAAARLAAYNDALAETAGLLSTCGKLQQEIESRVPALDDLDRQLTEIAALVARHEGDVGRLIAFNQADARRASLTTDLERSGAALAAWQDAQARRSQCEAELVRNPLTRERLSALEESVQQFQLAQSRAELPAAVDLEIALESDAVGRVLIDGTIAPRVVRHPVSATTTITVSGIGVFRIIPSDADQREERRAALVEAERIVNAHYAELAIANLEEARTRFEARRVNETAIAEAIASARAVAPNGGETLAEHVEHLRRELATLATLLVANDVVGEDGAALDLKALQAALAAARDLSMSVETQRNALDLADRLDRERLSAASARLGVLAEFLGADEERALERERLVAAAGAAQSAYDASTRARLLFEETAPSAERVRELIAAHREAVGNLRRVLELQQRLSEDIASLEGEVRAAGEAEIGPEVARLEGELEALEREIQGHEHEIAALDLLDRLLGEEEERNRSRFLQPVNQRLVPYLERVFPGASIVFDEGFGVSAITRNGETEPIDALSDGTREQIAILVRLSFGRLLAETGQPAPVILDDALVYSDDERIVSMFSAMELAAQQHQVVVFTCRAKTFESLNGSRLALRSWKP